MPAGGSEAAGATARSSASFCVCASSRPRSKPRRSACGALRAEHGDVLSLCLQGHLDPGQHDVQLGRLRVGRSCASASVRYCPGQRGSPLLQDLRESAGPPGGAAPDRRPFRPGRPAAAVLPAVLPPQMARDGAPGARGGFSNPAERSGHRGWAAERAPRGTLPDGPAPGAPAGSPQSGSDTSAARRSCTRPARDGPGCPCTPAWQPARSPLQASVFSATSSSRPAKDSAAGLEAQAGAALRRRGPAARSPGHR